MPMMVTMILCDAAQAVDNKLYVLGGGWSVTGPEPAPSAIALHLKVPWDEANLAHQMRLELLDADGQPVLAAPEGEPIVIETQFEVGRAAGSRPARRSTSPSRSTSGRSRSRRAAATSGASPSTARPKPTGTWP